MKTRGLKSPARRMDLTGLPGMVAAEICFLRVDEEFWTEHNALGDKMARDEWLAGKIPVPHREKSR